MGFKAFIAVAWRWVRRIAAAAAIIALAVFAWFAIQLETSKPQLAGQAWAAGLHARARIVRDAHGVPHIFGADDHDAYFALGYAHAQDRFFQMDLTRRSAEGRLAELVGALALRLDARARIKTLPAVIAAESASLSPQARAMLGAYADGVNARLASGAPGAEYALLFLKPAPWRIEDSVAVGVAMTENLTTGAEIDLARAELGAHLNPALFDQFFPPYPAWAPRSLERSGGRGGTHTSSDHPGAGSNAWALAGARTATGKPILANDPHLVHSAPGPFYLVHLKAPGVDLVGATLPGAPLIVVGANGRLAWGSTVNALDSADLIAAPGPAFQTIRTRTEHIRVRDWFSSYHEQTIDARETGLGPILDPKYFEIDAFTGRPVVLHSAALDRSNRVIDALRLMNGAQSVDQFIAASAGWTAPMTHLVVASTAGDIALVSAGAAPMRDKSGAWNGAVPRAAQFNLKNPAGGIVAVANNLAVPASYPYPTPGGYTPYRVARIRTLLAAGASRDVAAAGAMQTDTSSLFAARVLPVLISGARPHTKAAQTALKSLARWNYEMAADRPEPLIFAAWIDAFSRRLYRDEIGDETLYALYSGPRRSFLDSVLTGPAAAWCDDKTTQAVETCADLSGPALDDAVAQFQRRAGADPQSWRWGRVHVARFEHPLFARAPILSALFDVSIPIGGSGDAIFATEYESGDYTAVHGPSLRAVFDLADLNRPRFIVAPGQSGHPLSPHYRDLVADWAAGRSFEIRADIDPARPPSGFTTLVLVPAR